jgi:hypothetical protein
VLLAEYWSRIEEVLHLVGDLLEEVIVPALSR